MKNVHRSEHLCVKIVILTIANYNYNKDNFFKYGSRNKKCYPFYCRRGSVIVEFLVTFDPESNENISSVQSIMQQELNVTNSNEFFLGQFQLSGNRQTAVTYQGKYSRF